HLYSLTLRSPPTSTPFPHDALPISVRDVSHHPGHNRASNARSRSHPHCQPQNARRRRAAEHARLSRRLDSKRTSAEARHANAAEDRKSTRLNSSHLGISYAVFCLKK